MKCPNIKIDIQFITQETFNQIGMVYKGRILEARKRKKLFSFKIFQFSYLWNLQRYVAAFWQVAFLLAPMLTTLLMKTIGIGLGRQDQLMTSALYHSMPPYLRS